MLTVTWNWWYPGGCIRDTNHNTHVFRHRPYDGEDAATDIAQADINQNGTDGANSFEIEIFEPAEFAGIYDVELEWEPRAVATKRERARESV